MNLANHESKKTRKEKIIERKRETKSMMQMVRAITFARSGKAPDAEDGGGKAAVAHAESRQAPDPTVEIGPISGSIQQSHGAGWRAESWILLRRDGVSHREWNWK
jgi:hypothetical protein